MNDRDIQAIIGLDGTRGWEAIVERAKTRLSIMDKSLMNPSKERQEKLPDDYLRGQIEALEWMMDLPVSLQRSDAQLVAERREARKRSESADLIARLGPTFPGVSNDSWR